MVGWEEGLRVEQLVERRKEELKSEFERLKKYCGREISLW